MKRAAGLVIGLIAGTSLLSGCSGGGPPASVRDRIDRALTLSPGEGQPSKVVAAEIALERAARDNGQWTAFAQYASSGARIHLPEGPFPASTWLANRRNPAVTDRWSPRSVWISCDGSLAVSAGRFRTAEGKVGDFARVWQRTGRDEYRWAYHLAALDVPQPPARPLLGPSPQDEIIVTAFDSIKGFVADCPKPDRPVSVDAVPIAADGARSAGFSSEDGTLKARWDHSEEGQRRLTARYFSEGQWKELLDTAMDGPMGAAARQ